MVMLSPGMVETSIGLVGAWASGVVLQAWQAALTIASLAVVARFYVWEARLLVGFYRQHLEQTWTPGEGVAHRSEMDDPFLAVLARLRLLRPRPRCKGEFGPPEEHMEEPQRTEQALRRGWDRMLPWRCHSRHTVSAGYALETMPGWLGDAAGSRSGCWYLMVQMLFQISIAINVGFFYAHPWAPTSAGGLTQLVVLTICVFGGGFWTLMGTANDVLEGASLAVVYQMEAMANLLTMFANLIADPGDVDSVTTSLVFSEWSTRLLMWSIYVPLALPVYDALVVPIVQKVKGASDDPLAICLAFISACILVPFEILMIIFEPTVGCCMTAFCAVFAELEGSVIQDSILHEA